MNSVPTSFTISVTYCIGCSLISKTSWSGCRAKDPLEDIEAYFTPGSVNFISSFSERIDCLNYYPIASSSESRALAGSVGELFLFEIFSSRASRYYSKIADYSNCYFTFPGMSLPHSTSYSLDVKGLTYTLLSNHPALTFPSKVIIPMPY